MITINITKETRKNTNALLTRNKGVLQFLHAAAGYDFCKPYRIIKQTGNFTHKSMCKLISKKIASCDMEKFNISLIFTAGDKWRDYSNGYLDYAKINKDGFNAVDVIPRGVPSYKIYDFCRKSDFEEMRKNKSVEVYIIIQHIEYIKFPVALPCDYAARYKVVRYGSANWQFYIRQVGQENKSQSAVRYTSEIDKSGSCAKYAQQQLKHRAAELRSKRQKEKADIYDTTEQTGKLKAKAQEIRLRAVQALLNASDIDSLESVSSAVEGCLGRLKWAIYEITQHIKRSAEKSYNSPESADRAIKSIIESLEKAESEIVKAEILVYSTEETAEKTA